MVAHTETGIVDEERAHRKLTPRGEVMRDRNRVGATN